MEQETKGNQDLQQPNQPFLKIFTSRRWFWPCLVLLVLVVISLSGYAGWKNTQPESAQTPTNTSGLPELRVVDRAIQTTASNSTTSPTQSYQGMHWYLERTSKTGKETIFFYPDIEGNHLIQWGDTLFFAHGDYTDNVQVYSYNMTTGIKKIVYDQKARGDFLTENTRGEQRYVDSMKVIGNTLYFSTGGYLVEGALFSITLPSQDIIKIKEGPNPSLVEMDGKYWIREGEGDACWGFSDYYLFDLSTKKFDYIFGVSSDCGTGSDLIAIDKRGRMLVAYYEEKDGVQYKYVEAVLPIVPSSTEMLIPKEKMPQGVDSVGYSKGSDQLVLTGEASYIYDFASKSLYESKNIPGDVKDRIEYEGYKKIEDQFRELGLPPEYSLELR